MFKDKLQKFGDKAVQDLIANYIRMGLTEEVLEKTLEKEKTER